MNPLARELNEIIYSANPYTLEMLSKVGQNLFFPKGILTQSAEAKEKAFKYNATIGMAMEKGQLMYLPSIMGLLPGFKPEEALAYAPSYGIPLLREAWKKEILRKNPSLGSKEISLPVVTQAITHGLSVVGDMWIDPGDMVLIPDKTWGNYNMIFGVRRNAQMVSYPLFSGHVLDINSFNSCINEIANKTKKIVVILNFPNNPTGYSPSKKEALSIAEILLKQAEKENNIIALCDDAYFGLVYEEGIMEESIFALLSGLHPRILAIKLDAATKENFVWGLRVGFITYGTTVKNEARSFYEALEKKTAGCVRGSISNASRLSQEIILRNLTSPSYLDEKQQKYLVLKERAEEIKRLLATGKYDQNMEAYSFNSGYFMCVKVKGVKAEDLRLYLLDKYGIGVISLGDTDIRIAFSCVDKENLQDLFDTIDVAISELKKR